MKKKITPPAKHTLTWEDVSLPPPKFPLREYTYVIPATVGEVTAYQVPSSEILASLISQDVRLPAWFEVGDYILYRESPPRSMGMGVSCAFIDYIRRADFEAKYTPADVDKAL